MHMHTFILCLFYNFLKLHVLYLYINIGEFSKCKRCMIIVHVSYILCIYNTGQYSIKFNSINNVIRDNMDV